MDFGGLRVLPLIFLLKLKEFYWLPEFFLLEFIHNDRYYIKLFFFYIIIIFESFLNQIIKTLIKFYKIIIDIIKIKYYL